MKKALVLIIAFAGAYYAFHPADPAYQDSSISTASEARPTQPSGQWRAGQQVSGTGTVSRILSDDNDGSRHQRFILKLSSGRTLLIAHNIDLAPRLSSLREGDTVSFYGEYEPNDKGGVIHWTHSDPQGRHTPGWLEHNGRRYQ
jgi:Protein of unknown function (DUF3465)